MNYYGKDEIQIVTGTERPGFGKKVSVIIRFLTGPETGKESDVLLSAITMPRGERTRLRDKIFGKTKPKRKTRKTRKKVFRMR